jgi:DNA gyrase subunit A
VALRDGDLAVGMEVLRPGKTILTVTENGFGKRSPLDDYREQNRGGQGIITIKTTERNGAVVGVLQVADADEVMVVSNAGKILRIRVSQIPTIGRNTQGVRIMDCEEGERVVSVARLAEPEDDAEGRSTMPVPGDA